MRFFKILLGITFYPYGVYLLWKYFNDKRNLKIISEKQKPIEKNKKNVSKEPQKVNIKEPIKDSPQQKRDNKKPKAINTGTTKTTKDSPQTKNLAPHELDNELEGLELELNKKIREDSRYSGGILKSQIRQVISTIKLNIIYIQTIRLFSIINNKKKTSIKEINKEKTLNRSYLEFINSQLQHNQRFKGALIEAHNQQLNLCVSAINLNNILTTIINSKKSEITVDQLKKEIKEAEALSAKYKPCLVKSNIELRMLILSISLNTINMFGENTLTENKIKASIKEDENKINSLKANLYTILLSIRKKSNEILLTKLTTKSSSETVKIKKSNTTEIKTITSEIKKYAPSTYKYLLAIQREYCQYLSKS